MRDKDKFQRVHLPYLIIIFVLICICAVLSILAFGQRDGSSIEKSESGQEYLTDAVRFRYSYEKLNGTTREDGTYLPPVSVNEENVIHYVTPEEAWELIDRDETVLIVFGAAWCRWCRVAAPMIVDVANANDLDVVYYVEVEKAEKEKSEERLSLEELMSDYLKQAGTSFANVTGTQMLITEYQEYLKDGDELLFPVTLFINKGNLTGMHVGTAEDQTDVTEALTQQQIDAFRQAYRKHLDVLGTSPCGRC